MNSFIPVTPGRTLPLSLPRKFICDVVHFAKKVPSLAMQRSMRLKDIRDARAYWPSRASWCAIFMKAYAIVSADRPELRRTYLSFPQPRLYEHPENIAAFSVERMYEGEPAVFCSMVHRPEELSLAQLDQWIRVHKTAEVTSVDSFRRALRLTSLPRPLRRLAWWMGLNLDGARKAQYFGTFAISVVASLGAASVQLLSTHTTALNYGAFEPDGTLDVRLTYDHRVLDGATVARALAALEDVLHQQIYEELLSGATTIAPPAIAIPLASASEIAA